MTEFNLIKIDGKPLEKLVDVISKGIGTLYKPRAIRKEAEAKAYEIEIIERAKAKALAEGKEIEADTYDRIQERIIHKELKRQNNIENISQIAAEQFYHDEVVSEEEVNEDWITRFFNIAEDISDEEMQQLWGRILAGEVKQPNSYSLRTMDFIRNLSKNEADIIMKIARFSIELQGDFYFFKGNDEYNYIEEKFDISYSDLALLKEIGVLQPSDFTTLHFNREMGNDAPNVFIAGNIGIVMEIKPNTPTFEVSIDVFSSIGKELLKLVESKPPYEYLDFIVKSIQSPNVDFKYGKITMREDDKIALQQPLLNFN